MKTYYFDHDVKTTADYKIQQLIMDFGMEGYGIFWYLIEKLFEMEGKSDKTNYDFFAYQTRTTPEVIKKIVENYGLFEIEDEVFLSKRIIDTINYRKVVSKKNSENGKKSGIARALKNKNN